jgi:hypothetical protein
LETQQAVHPAVTGVKAACRVDDANHRSIQRIIAIASTLDKGLTKKKRKLPIAVVCKASMQTLGLIVARGTSPGIVFRL